MYRVKSTRAFRKAFKKYLRRIDFNPKVLREVVFALARGEQLDPKYRDHQLSGELSDRRECHLKHNLLLVYRKRDDVLVLLLIDLGSHDDLF